MKLSLPFLIILSSTLFAQERAPNVKVELLTNFDGKEKKFFIGVKFKIEPGWYIYWKNPGDAGLPPRIDLVLPSGMKSGDVIFPIPKKIVHGDVTSFGYYDEVVFLIPVEIISANVAYGSNVKAKIEWVVCKESCVFGSEEKEIKLIGSPSEILSAKKTFERYLMLVPKNFSESGLEIKDATIENAGGKFKVQVIFSGVKAKLIRDFYPYLSDDFVVDLKSVKVKNGVLEFYITPSSNNKNIFSVAGVLILQDKGYEVKFNLKQK